ncbi:hypothetical protein PIB30_015477 [Stylosanthes scabra]|uniref:Uncharacterized protein n=1 Tax=Stylosanthes scabra TaxID=79078 RepID=A0ABU6W532_9FABA|nr:hypothetical protein [Stylosanthes scabra]
MAVHPTISTPLPTMAPRLTMDSGAIQNGRPQPHITNPGSRRIPSAIDRLFETVVTTPIIILATFHSVVSLCLTNGLTNDDFKKQLTTKPMRSRKRIHVIAKEFIYHKEVSRMVKTTKNPHTHTAPRVNAKPHNPRDNQQDFGFKGQPKPLKQKFKNTAPLAASITEIYPKISEKRRPSPNQTPKRKNPKYKKQIFVL